jgi:CHAD domain-containing protein
VEQEHVVAHEYDTVDRDLEQLGMRIARLPSEAGVVWRLELPRGERVEAWEPGNAGLAPPEEITRFTGAVTAGKALVPSPPVGDDPGAHRLRELLAAARRSLLAHDPGTRLGADPENLHQHRVAARRARAYLRATRAHVDPDWRRELDAPLRGLAAATGPVRDLDVLLEHVQPQLRGIHPEEALGAGTLVWELAQRRERAQHGLADALDDDGYRELLGRLHFPVRLRDGVETVPLERLARREFRRLAKAVARLGKQPEDGAIHRLRVLLKHARYAAELAPPAAETGRNFVEAAKALQVLLGEHQDAAVAESLLRASAIVDARTGAAFVAGRLAERQAARRERVRAQLPRAWRRLRKAARSQ